MTLFAGASFTCTVTSIFTSYDTTQFVSSQCLTAYHVLFISFYVGGVFADIPRQIIKKWRGPLLRLISL